ncbi:GldM family protein [Chryseobacterium sediminis]|uniref:GldM family protein n=1 Tax=Chryseobacterium sediminis TaxID=1679494 RepID=UPI00286012C9|nr:GldM family protein [Chryseobacterium sediminis]MDR6463932.1 hypothetical protein [Chryseobacterium sediminis]
MKKFIYYPLILCVCSYCTPRKQILSSKDSNIKSIIENEKLNILYRGIKNDLTIYMPESDSIKVSGSGVYKEGENKYFIIPGTGSSMEMTITGFIKGKAITDKREFRILNINNPFASINNKIEKITLSKEELADSKIEYFIPQFIMKLGKVSKFRYQINEGEPMVNYGDRFNKPVKEKIFNLESGDYIIIDELSSGLELENIDLKKITPLKVFIK